METSQYLLLGCSISLRTILALQTVIIIVIFASLHCFLKRLYFHPLSKIPGPRLAAATFWYEFYYNAIRDGTYIKRFQQLHTKYNSPVIRISPNHVHVNDPNFFSTIFHNKTDYLKDPGFFKSISMSESLLAVLDPQDHRIRRQKVSPLFSTKATDMMAPKVLAIAQKAATCMAERGRQQRPIDMHRLCRSFSAEVLFKTLLGQSQDFIGSQEEHPELLKSIDAFLSHIWMRKSLQYFFLPSNLLASLADFDLLITVKSFPIISWLALNMPQSLAQRAVPGFKKFRDNCEKWAELSIDRQASGKALDDNNPLTNTLFDLILAPSTDYDPSPSTIPDLVDEAFLFVIAGTDSSGNTMANALYYILSSPSISSRLLKELQDNGITSQESFDCRLVQRLPYLTAVLKETMRIYTLAPGLFPRIVTDEGVTIGDHYIPAGTVISETIHSIHHNPSTFPSPSTFNPERWLNDPDKALEKFFVPYSKGSRACLGMNLANAEMYIILALLFSRFEMELYGTDARSVEWVDRGNAVNRSTVKVCVKRDRWAS